MRDTPPVDGAFIAVGPAGRPGQYLQVRVRIEDVRELQDLIAAEQIEGPPVLVASLGVTEVAALLASIGGGLGGLAAVVAAYVHRHDGTQVTLMHSDTVVDMSGLSEAARRREIDRALRFCAERQEATEHLYTDLGVLDGGASLTGSTDDDFAQSHRTAPVSQPAGKVPGSHGDDVRISWVDTDPRIVAHLRSATTSLVVLPSRVKGDGAYYTSDDGDLVKESRAEGVQVAFARSGDSQYLHEYSAGPLAEFAVGVLGELTAGAIASIATMIGIRARTIWRQRTHNGTAGTVPMSVTVTRQFRGTGHSEVQTVAMTGTADDIAALLPQILGQAPPLPPAFPPPSPIPPPPAFPPPPAIPPPPTPPPPRPPQRDTPEHPNSPQAPDAAGDPADP